MAFQYTTGTINQPDAGSVGLAMVERIRDDVVAHPAWDLVEEYYPAASATRWYIFKCLASQSGLPADYFVVIGRILATGELRIGICETYNAAAHQMTNFAPISVGSNITYDEAGRLPAANPYTLASSTFSNGANNPFYMQWIPSGTSTKWWIIVTNDGFTVAFNGASNGFFHVGTYTPLTQLPILMPIAVLGNNGYSTYNTGITRNPAVAGLAAGGYSSALSVRGGGGQLGQAPAGAILGFEGFWQYNDKLQNNQRPMAELGMVMDSTSGGTYVDWPQMYGYALGKLKRMRYSGQPKVTGLAFGDAFVLNGTLWVPAAPNDGRIWDTGVAST